MRFAYIVILFLLFSCSGSDEAASENNFDKDFSFEFYGKSRVIEPQFEHTRNKFNVKSLLNLRIEDNGVNVLSRLYGRNQICLELIFKLNREELSETWTFQPSIPELTLMNSPEQTEFGQIEKRFTEFIVEYADLDLNTVSVEASPVECVNQNKSIDVPKDIKVSGEFSLNVITYKELYELGQRAALFPSVRGNHIITPTHEKMVAYVLRDYQAKQSLFSDSNNVYIGGAMDNVNKWISNEGRRNTNQLFIPVYLTNRQGEFGFCFATIPVSMDVNNGILGLSEFKPVPTWLEQIVKLETAHRYKLWEEIINGY